MLAGTQVLLRWTGADAVTSAPWIVVPATATSKTLVVPEYGPVPVKHGARHKVTLTASIEGRDANLAATAHMWVEAVGSPLVAALKGASDYKANRQLLLSASGSYDPDGENLDLLAQACAWISDAKHALVTRCQAGAVEEVPDEAAAATHLPPLRMLAHLHRALHTRPCSHCSTNRSNRQPQTFWAQSPSCMSGPAAATTACPALPAVSTARWLGTPGRSRQAC